MASQVTQVQQFFNGYKQNVGRALRDASKPWTKAFDTVEEKTGVDRVNIFIGECVVPATSSRVLATDTAPLESPLLTSW